MGPRGGKWKFTNKANGQSILVDIADPSPSKIKAGLDAARTALSPANDSLLFAIDPRGREYRFTGVELGKKFNR